MKQIIGIVGRAKSGKTLVSTSMAKVAKDLGHPAQVFELSQIIVQGLYDEGKLPTNRREDLDKIGLQAMIKYGVAKVQKIPGYWMNLLMEKIDQSDAEIAICPNIRFIHEAYIIRKHGGILVRVRSMIQDGVEWISPDRDPNDPTETENYNIKADYFLETIHGQTILLRRQAETLMRYLLKERNN